MAKGKYYTHVEPKLIAIEGWARDGLSNEQIAKNLGINPDTLYRYKRQYSELSEALKKGKEVSDYEVENALFKRAIGFTYSEITTEILPDGTTREKVIEKTALPDTTAQIFWLKNRRPDKWRDKQHVESEIKAEVSNPLDGMSVEELEALLEK